MIENLDKNTSWFSAWAVVRETRVPWEECIGSALVYTADGPLVHLFTSSLKNYFSNRLNYTDFSFVIFLKILYTSRVIHWWELFRVENLFPRVVVCLPPILAIFHHPFREDVNLEGTGMFRLFYLCSSSWQQTRLYKEMRVANGHTHPRPDWRYLDHSD